MKPLSETYKKLGIAFDFPIKIKDADGYKTYFENSNDFWARYEYDAKGYLTYREDSNGSKWGTPKSSKTCEGKVIEVDGLKYKLTAL